MGQAAPLGSLGHLGNEHFGKQPLRLAAWKPHVLDRWCVTLLVSLCWVAFGFGSVMTVFDGSTLLQSFTYFAIWVVILGVWFGLGYLQIRLSGMMSMGSGIKPKSFWVDRRVGRIQNPQPCFCHQIPGREGCSKPSAQARVMRSFCINRPCWLLVGLLSCSRIGEAKLPGPANHSALSEASSASQSKFWTLGVCNPSGLPNKAHLLAQNSTDIWAVSESHLSIQGARVFKKNLRQEQSQYKWCVPGFPVTPRSTLSNHGSWSGVAIISKHPTRELPHAWPEHVYETSRILCTTTLINNFWLTGVTAYGLPTGPTHPRAKEKCNLLIQAAVNRLLLQDGPRFLAGDFNQDLADLPAIQVLLDHHFVEIQNLNFSLTGTPPVPTCKGRTQRDFLFISRELIPMFANLTIDSTTWPDHSTLVASFVGSGADLVRFPWPKPHAVDWRICQHSEPLPVLDFQTTSDCTALYQTFWEAREQTHQHAAHSKGIIVPPGCYGRGQRLKPQTVRGNIAPIKKGRDGEFQPKYFGISFVHRHWVKQVRRLQSFVRLCKVVEPNIEHREHQALLWHSIVNAPGFAPCFSEWWTHRTLAVGEPDCIPAIPPGLVVSTAIFQAMQWETSKLEAQLNRRRLRHTGQQSGLAQVYAAVKRDAPQPVDVLVKQVQVSIQDVDTDTCAFELCEPVAFDPDKPIRCGPQVLQPIMITPDKIWVENLHDIQKGSLLVQDRFKGSLPELFEAFTLQWQQRWDRHADLPLSHWEGLLHFASLHLGSVTPQQPQFSVPQVRATVAGKKSQAAIGLDGVSRQDLISLGSNDVLSIVSIFQRAHTDGMWPKQLLQGQVTNLAKRPCPESPDHFRPITVFSLVLRTWSTIVSRFWLQALGQIVDERLYGNRAHCRAAHLWRCILDAVEFAYNTHTACGVVFDLEKAFNCLPRKITLAFGKLAGIDQGALFAWAGMLGSMERRFAIMGSLSPAVTSSCGFAEGCGMSVVAMLLIDQVWHQYMKIACAMCKPMSFVDNWEIAVSNPNDIQTVFDATLAFAQQLDVSVDRAKTFVWATHPEHRKTLRRRNFHVCLDHPDLGAHLTYSCQIRNASLVARFHGLADFWEKLRGAGGPFSCKVRAVGSAAWPRALHGISATWVSLKHIHDLRSKYMWALHLNKPGANSFLQLHLDGFGLDPNAFAIMQTLRDFRDLGSTDWHVGWLDQVTNHPPSLGPNTITRVLQKRLAILDWQFRESDVVCDDLGPFHLSSIDWAELCLRVQRSWHKFVHGQVAHRADFAGFQDVDFGATRQCVNSLPCIDQGICRRNMNGSTLTNEHSCFWTTSGDHTCQFCGAADSLFHRYWECSESSDLRASLGHKTLQTIALMPPACIVRSWQLQSPLTDEWWRYLLLIPKWQAPSVELQIPHDGCLDFFTDGSCFWQSNKAYRLAAWSICLAQPLSLTGSSWETHVVSAGPVSGLVQTSFRAELTAVVQAVKLARQKQCRVRIWTDSQSVVDRAGLLLTGQRRVKPNSANSDLWKEFLAEAQDLGSHRITLVKVAAHEAISVDDTEFERWCKFNNSCADAAAKAANADRPPEIWRLWEQFSGQVVGLQQLGRKILQHQLEVCKRWTQEADRTHLAAPQQPRQVFVPEGRFEVTPLPAHPSAEIQQLLGERYSLLLFQWWQHWIDPNAVPRWISFAQCFIGFQLWAKHPGAVRRGRRWIDPTVSLLSLPETNTFRVRCKWFRLQLQQIWKCLGRRISTITTRPFSDQLPCHIGCVALPVKQECLLHVDEWLAAKTVQPLVGHGQAMDSLPLPW